MSIEKNTKNTLSHENGGFTTLINNSIQNIKHTGALGVYCYLASMPSGWNICKKQLQNHFDCGRLHINTCFKHLKQIGAIEIRCIRNDKGQIEEWNTELKIRIQNTDINQNTGFRYSGDLTTIPVSENLVNRESRKSAPINKDSLETKIYKKQNKMSVSVFSGEKAVQDHVVQVVKARNVAVSHDIIQQIVFYIGALRIFDDVNKKINIALKKVRENKWNIPSGYKGVTSKSIREREELSLKQKKEFYEEEKNIFKKIVPSSKLSEMVKRLPYASGQMA